MKGAPDLKQWMSLDNFERSVIRAELKEIIENHNSAVDSMGDD